MLSTRKTILTLALAAVLALPALAQGPRGGRGEGFGRGGPGMLIQNEGVQKELKLSSEQVQKCKDAMQEVRSKHQEEFTKLRDLDPQERREKMPPLMKTVNEETTKALAGILTPDQDKRLKQITLQQRGTEAFNDSEVQAALKLTDDQKEKIKTINEDARKEMRELFQNGQGRSEESRKQFETLRKDTMDKATAVLTDGQKKEWKDLAGEPFHVQFQRRQGAPRSRPNRGENN